MIIGWLLSKTTDCWQHLASVPEFGLRVPWRVDDYRKIWTPAERWALPNNSLVARKHSNYVITFSPGFLRLRPGASGWFVITDDGSHPRPSPPWNDGHKKPRLRTLRAGSRWAELERVQTDWHGSPWSPFGGVARARAIAPQCRVHMMMICSFCEEHLGFLLFGIHGICRFISTTHEVLKRMGQ